MAANSEPPWYIRVFPKIKVNQNAWFIMENPIKMDDLGVPQFSETYFRRACSCVYICSINYIN